MTALCIGRDPELWWTGNPGNRLAVSICRRCEGCPDDDPTPHGVIRRGVAYSDSGRPLPECSACGGPNTAYTGGDSTLKVCGGCKVPQVAIPKVHGARNRWIAAMHRRGLPTALIVAETGVTEATVWLALTADRRSGQVTA